MLRWLIGFLTPSLVGGVIEAYKARLAAGNVTDRIAADLAAKAIEGEIAARRQAAAVIIAEQGRWYTAIVRPLFAAPFVIFAWKVVVWDKVLGLGSTDALGGAVADWAGYVLAAYFGGRSIEKVAQILRR